jgi:peptide-methionine (S)-S-oxide reductase
MIEDTLMPSMARIAFTSAAVIAGSMTAAQAQQKAVATFAGGCFWSIEKAFDGRPGVVSAVSGFMGGTTPDPTYQEVVRGRTGHLEAVQVVYDPAKISYGQLLDIFWHDIDPTNAYGQFCDMGSQYETAVFVNGAEQKRQAEASKSEVARELKAEVATKILVASAFTAAGPEHQDFATTNPGHYASYLRGCGRETKLRAVWGSKAHAKL